MPTIVETKLSQKLPEGEYAGRITGMGPRPTEVVENGRVKRVTYMEFRISQIRGPLDERADAPPGVEIDDEQEVRVGYPIPFTQASMGGALLNRFGHPVTSNGTLDLEPMLLGKQVTFELRKKTREAEFADVSRESVAPLPKGWGDLHG